MLPVPVQEGLSMRAVLEVELFSPEVSLCSVSIASFSADTVTVRYDGLPANQPKTYGNYVALWEGSVVPWGVEPDAQQAIVANKPGGTVVMSGLTITKSTYIVGYSVGTGDERICATALLSAGGLRAAPTSVTISINSVGTDSLAMNYATLSGYLPKKHGNWIGVWRGYVSPYNCPAPLGVQKIPTDNTEGTVGINGVSIGVDATYTVIYFMGQPELTQNNTLAAAILTFNTGSDIQYVD